VVVACSENGDVFVYRKNGPIRMKLVHKLDGRLNNNAYTTDNIAIIEKRGVFVDQIYVFVTQKRFSDYKM